MIPPLTAILRNDPAEGIAFAKKIQEFLRENKVEEKAAYSLRLIFEELFTNILKYAFPNGASGQIQAYLIPEKTQLVICVKDNGTAFNPTHSPKPDFDRPLSEKQAGGLGLYLVGELSKALNYERKNGWNEVRVTVPR